jgi:predicted nuclease with TOPRIM domain
MEIALGVCITLLIALLGLLMNHISKCSEFHERIARLESLPAEVSKLREHAHENRGAILRLESKFTRLDER